VSIDYTILFVSEDSNIFLIRAYSYAGRGLQPRPQRFIKSISYPARSGIGFAIRPKISPRIRL